MTHEAMPFRERYAAQIAQLRARHPGFIRDARPLHLPASVPPWTDTGIEVARGEPLTVLADGRVFWSRDADLSVGPRYVLWGRIGDGDIFRLGSDTRTLTATDGGSLRLCSYHGGTWASPKGPSPCRAKPMRGSRVPSTRS